MRKNYLKLFYFTLLTLFSLSCENVEPTPEPYTPIEPFTITIEGTEVSTIKASIAYSANEAQHPYFVGVIPKSAVTELNDLNLFNAVSSMISEPTTVDGKYIFEGDATITLSPTWTIEPGTEYYVVALACNEQMELLTNVQSKLFNVGASIVGGEPTDAAMCDSGESLITFSSNSSWTATLKDATSNWITLDKESGEAGEATITASYGANNTGEDRLATIVVSSAGNDIELDVIQRGAIFTVSEITESNYPSEVDVWTFTDSNVADSFGFDGLTDAIRDITYNNPTRKITFKFPNLTSIPHYSFFASASDVGLMGSLEYVEAPVATFIGQNAFKALVGLKGISAPLATEIDDLAFLDCFSLTEVEFEAVHTLGHLVFENCKSLKTISLPNALDVATEVFRGCIELRTLKVGTESGLNTFGTTVGDMFNGIDSRNIDFYTLDPKVEAELGFYYAPTAYGDYIYAFKSINDVAATVDSKFALLNDYGSISYPTDSDTWTIYDPSAVATGFDNLIKALQNIDGSREITIIFKNISTLPDNTFFDHPNTVPSMVSVEFEQLSSAGSRLFSNCPHLQTVKLPKLTSIDFGGFEECPKLTYLEMATAGNGKITKFGDYQMNMFKESNSLKMIDLVIGEQSAEYINTADGLFLAPDPQGNTNTYGPFKTINGIAPTVEVVVDKAADYSADLYPTSDHWTVTDAADLSYAELGGIRSALNAIKDSGRKITLEFTLTEEIAHDAFNDGINDLKALHTVIFHKAATMGNRSFKNCSGLEVIDLPLLYYTGNNVFENCSSLKTLVLGTKSTSPSWYAYIGSSPFTGVDLAQVDLTVGEPFEDDANVANKTFLGYGPFKSVTILIDQP